MTAAGFLLLAMLLYVLARQVDAMMPDDEEGEV